MAWTKLPCRGLCLSPWERVWEQGPPRVSRSCPNVGDRAPGWVCPAGVTLHWGDQHGDTPSP